MNQIKYNEKEEAFEITYKLWDKDTTVRFYVEDQQDIMDNLSDIAQKLEKINRNRKKIAALLMDEGYYEGGDEEILIKHISLEKVYVDIDEDGVVVCFTVDSEDGYMPKKVSMELGADNGIEAVGTE